MIPRRALEYEMEVGAEGRIEVSVPFHAGAHVTVIVIDHADQDGRELLAASQSSLGFWENPIDDEDWNNA